MSCLVCGQPNKEFGVGSLLDESIYVCKECRDNARNYSILQTESTEIREALQYLVEQLNYVAVNAHEVSPAHQNARDILTRYGYALNAEGEQFQIKTT